MRVSDSPPLSNTFGRRTTVLEREQRIPTKYTYVIVVSVVLGVMEYRVVKRERRGVVFGPGRCGQRDQDSQADGGDLKRKKESNVSGSALTVRI